MPWISAGIGLVGSMMGSSSASSAAAQQKAATDAAVAEQKRQYDTTRSDYAPFRASGVAANNELMRLLGLGSSTSSAPAQTREQLRAQLQGQFTRQAASQPLHYVDGAWLPSSSLEPFGQQGGGIDEAGLNAAVEQAYANQPQAQSTGTGQPVDMSAEVMADPGYQFGLKQGQMGLDRKAAAGGSRLSGATLKAASQYNNDYATTKYSSIREDRLNRLAALAGIGQTATAGTAAAGAGAAGNNANLITAQGNASGAATLAQGNIWQNAANSLGATYKNNPNMFTGGSSGPSNAQLASTYGF